MARRKQLFSGRHVNAFYNKLSAASAGPKIITSLPEEDPGYGTDWKGESEFQNSFLLIPKYDYDTPEDVDRTSAPAASARAPQHSRLELREPSKPAYSVLQRIGLQDFEKVRILGTPQQRLTPRSGQGVFARLGAMGMAAAYFRKEDQHQAARNELQDAYEFVPNFPLTIPLRVRMDEVPATRGRTALEADEWPDESGVRAAWRQGVRGAGVLVGVIDTGIDADHQEFAHQTVPFRYVPLLPNDLPPRDIRGFDTDGHGTHVSGIIGGKTVGVAPEASLYVSGVIESETTRTSLIRVAAGLEWVLRQFSRPENEQRPAVLNLSLGFPANPPPGIPPAEWQVRFRIMRTLLNTLAKANVLPVVAIGNDGPGVFRYPGAFRDVVAVGAVDFQRNVAPFSGSGTPQGEGGVSKPDLMGYGVGVYSSLERAADGRSIYQRLNGTSMATPYVAGVVALHRCKHPTWTVSQILEDLRGSALPVSGNVSAGLCRFPVPAPRPASTGNQSVSGAAAKVGRKRTVGGKRLSRSPVRRR
ncbi:MAG TPA: S8 family serine peptidase [Humisphaera sp.]